jgi:hypothetical protein
MRSSDFSPELCDHEDFLRWKQSRAFCFLRNASRLGLVEPTQIAQLFAIRYETLAG